jgi:hypothetical protein
MKPLQVLKTSIASLILIISVQAASCQIDNSLAKSNPNAPEIYFEKTVYNFGSILKGKDGSTEFIFKNTGKGPLILSNVEASCDCTTPQWPKEPVMPGKTATIKVVYDTKKLGVFNKTITVSSNAISNKVELTIQGEVYE